MDHVLTVLAKVPELSLDENGMDAWGSQGIASAPTCDTRLLTPPDWMQYTSLKNPWLYAERATPNAHVAFTDIGDLRFVHTDGTCPLPDEHPAIILNTPSSRIHVTLEDVTQTTNPRMLWDNWFSLKNSAPGGNGIKVVSYQQPAEEGEDFIPFCFPSLKEIDFLSGTKYKLTVESVPDANDISIKPWKDEIILRPRPLCDTTDPSTLRVNFL
jgi:hypothetical protein